MQEPSIERIRNATFALTVRGYDRNEVDRYLAQIADWLETGGGGGAAAVEAVRTELEQIGERTSGILSEAHQAAEGIRADASAGARQQLVEANNTAETVRAEAAEYAADTRDEADAYARKVRSEADAYASRTTAEIESELSEEREAAKKDAARTVADANKRKSDIESVITDLEKRREAVLAELERLASGITGTASEHRPTEGDRPEPEETDEVDVLGDDETSVLDEETDETTVIAAEKD